MWSLWQWSTLLFYVLCPGWILDSCLRKSIRSVECGVMWHLQMNAVVAQQWLVVFAVAVYLCIWGSYSSVCSILCMFHKWFLGIGAQNADELWSLKGTVMWLQFKINQCLDSYCQYLLIVNVFVMMTAMFVEGWKCFNMWRCSVFPV